MSSTLIPKVLSPRMPTFPTTLSPVYPRLVSPRMITPTFVSPIRRRYETMTTDELIHLVMNRGLVVREDLISLLHRDDASPTKEQYERMNINELRITAIDRNLDFSLSPTKEKLVVLLERDDLSKSPSPIISSPKLTVPRVDSSTSSIVTVPRAASPSFPFNTFSIPRFL